MGKFIKHNSKKPTTSDSIEYEISQRGGDDGTWEEEFTGEYTQFLYVLQGSYDIRLGGREFPLPAGSMVLLGNGESYSIRGRRKKRALISVKLFPEELFGSDSIDAEYPLPLDLINDGWESRRIFTPDLPSAPLIRSIFEKIKDEYVQRSFGYRLSVRAEIMRLFAAVIRYRYAEGKAGAGYSPGSTQLLVRKARCYIEEKYSEATLSSAARACGVSYSYLSRVFKETMNMSFSDYLNRVRVNRSLRQLVSTDHNITDIALSVGFSSTSYYIQTFRRMKGCSPNKYRKRNI